MTEVSVNGNGHTSDIFSLLGGDTPSPVLVDPSGNPIWSEAMLLEALDKEKPSKRGDLLSELGTGGVSYFSGFADSDEFNDKLIGQRGVLTYDKMRRTDAQVQALLFAILLPITSANWTINRPVGNEEEGKKITDEHLNFARENFFHRMDWPSTLRHSLSCLWAGFSWFEKVMVVEDGKFYISKLAPRLASTLYKWWTDDHDNLVAVTQKIKNTDRMRRRRDNNRGNSIFQTPDGRGLSPDEVVIRRDKLVLFSYQKEGNNYEGMSILRAPYKHWFIKDQIYRIDAIRHERFAIGIPHISLPENYSTDDMDMAIKIGKNWRGGAQAYLVTPDGWTAEVIQMTGGGLDILGTIQHHNEEIAKAGLAQFINFGTTQTGSRALGESTTNFFYDAELTLADWIRSVFNRDVLWPLMDLNFAGAPRPELIVDDIGAISLSELVTSLSSIGSEFLTPDMDIENRVRELMRLPIREDDDDDDDDERKPRGGGRQTLDPEDIDTPEQDDLPVSAESIEGRKFLLYRAQGHEDYIRADKPRIALGEFWRGLTDLEEYIRLEEIESAMDSARNRMMHRVLNVRDTWARTVAEQMEVMRQPDARPTDVTEINLTAADVDRMRKNILPIFNELYRFGARTVSEELRSQAESLGVIGDFSVRLDQTVGEEGLLLRDDDDMLTFRDALDIFGVKAQEMAQRITRKTVDSARAAALTLFRTKGPADISDDDVRQLLNDMMGVVENESKLAAGFNISESFNMGRDASAQQLAKDIDVAIYSALLDGNTCRNCRIADGRVANVGSAKYYRNMPPLHSCLGRGRCRCIWTYKLKTEES